VNQNIAIATGVLGLLAGGSALAASAVAPGSIPAHPDAVFHDVRLWQFRGSALDAEGQAGELSYQRTAAQMQADRPSGELFARTGQVETAKPDLLLGRKPLPLDVRADHLTVLTKQNRGVWKGHVHAVRPATAQRPELQLFCDELTTDLSGEDRLQNAVCTGNVQVVQGDRTGWGEKAVYDGARGELVVTGNPRGEQGPNRFRGEKLTFMLDSDRIEVERPVLDTPAPNSASAVPRGGR
jgi:lipopolysaccharide transport protein LptA